MKATSDYRKPKTFTPVVFTVTVETPEKLNSLYAQINGAPSQCDSFNSDMLARNDHTMEFFKAIRKVAEEQLERK